MHSIVVTDISKFIHMIMAISLFGLTIMNYVYTQYALSAPSKDRITLLKQACLLDKISFGLIVLTVLTGSALVTLKNYTFTTPWVTGAYIALSLITLLIYINLRIRRSFITSILNNPIRNNSITRLKHRFWLHINIILLAILFVIVVHDVVEKHTII